VLEVDVTFYIIVAGSFLTALSNVAFSAGGAIAVTSTVLPVSAIAPIHSTLLIGFIHSLVSTLFAYGAFLHAVILRPGSKGGRS